MPTRKRNQVNDLFDTAEAVPDPSARSRGKRRYRTARRAVFASVILAPLNVIGLILMFSIVLNGVDDYGSGDRTGRGEPDRPHPGRTFPGAVAGGRRVRVRGC